MEAAQANDLACDFAEEAFHQVEPRGGGGGKVQMKALLAGEPSFDSGMFVRGVIVADDMDLFIGETEASIFFRKASYSL